MELLRHLVKRIMTLKQYNWPCFTLFSSFATLSFPEYCKRIQLFIGRYIDRKLPNLTLDWTQSRDTTKVSSESFWKMNSRLCRRLHTDANTSITTSITGLCDTQLLLTFAKRRVEEIKQYNFLCLLANSYLHWISI